jgi:hypothetical protein
MKCCFAFIASPLPNIPQGNNCPCPYEIIEAGIEEWERGGLTM